MNFEAIHLQKWYASPLGGMARQRIDELLEQWLADRHVQRTLGLGFYPPYQERLESWSDSLLGAAPAEMGVTASGDRDNRCALIRPDALAFPDALFDRVAMFHFLEGAQSPRAALREVWRVLQPGGRLLCLVPNRGGLWARRDITPFGWGSPFSPSQLHELLYESLFIPRRFSFALFLPPLTGTRWLSTASTWEKFGGRWMAPMGGAILCEAEKVVYATNRLKRYPELVGVRSMSWPVAENRHWVDRPHTRHDEP